MDPAPPWMEPRYGHLRRGVAYRVMEAFVDHDRCRHEVGEPWVFLGSSYLAYDNGLSLFAVIDGVERQVRLWDKPEGQEAVVRRLDRHLVESPH